MESGTVHKGPRLWWIFPCPASGQVLFKSVLPRTGSPGACTRVSMPVCVLLCTFKHAHVLVYVFLYHYLPYFLRGLFSLNLSVWMG